MFLVYDYYSLLISKLFYPLLIISLIRYFTYAVRTYAIDRAEDDAIFEQSYIKYKIESGSKDSDSKMSNDVM